jgi:hypothetical protein
MAGYADEINVTVHADDSVKLRAISTMPNRSRCFAVRVAPALPFSFRARE